MPFMALCMSGRPYGRRRESFLGSYLGAGLDGLDSHRNQTAVRMTHDPLRSFVASASQSVGECVVKRPRLVRNFPENEHLFVCCGS